MISKQRLKELIEQGATIYSISKETFIAGVSDLLKIKPLKLDSKVYGISVDKYNEINNCKPHLYIGNDYTPFEKVAELEDLFETEEDARWELEMTATRTETLKLPSFNELQTKKEYYKNFALYFYLAIDMPYKKDYGAVIISQNDLKGNSYIIFDKPLTKENYIEACKLCLRLFRGEEV